MKKILLLLVCQTISSTFSQDVCRKDFEETLCENFKFTPELLLDSPTKKITIRDAEGSIIHENFAKLNQVSEMIIRRSDIAKIEPAALCCLPKLTSISLVENRKLPKVTNRVLQGCQQIKRLNLDGEIPIENGAFAAMEALQTLTLNGTVLPPSLGKEFFKGLDTVRSLTIRNSRFTGIKENAFGDMKKMRFLDLQFNNVDTIVKETFQGLSDLKVLNLADNKLKNLTWEEFDGLKSLQVLFLERNEFDNVDVDKLMASVPKLERIFLSYDKLVPQSRKMVDEVLKKLNVTVIYSGHPND